MSKVPEDIAREVEVKIAELCDETGRPDLVRLAAINVELVELGRAISKIGSTEITSAYSAMVERVMPMLGAGVVGDSSASDVEQYTKVRAEIIRVIRNATGEKDV